MAGATAAVDYLASVGERFGGEWLDRLASYVGRRRKLKAAMSAIRDYEMELCRHMISGLEQVPDLQIYGITDPAGFERRVPTVSFTMHGLSPAEIAGRLAAANIAVWNGNFYALAVTERLGLEEGGGLLRVGLTHYNTASEVDALLGVLADMPR
jgi:selenocysteine lyase/cysteine desulfurase